MSAGNVRGRKIPTAANVAELSIACFFLTLEKKKTFEGKTQRTCRHGSGQERQKEANSDGQVEIKERRGKTGGQTNRLTCRNKREKERKKEPQWTSRNDRVQKKDKRKKTNRRMSIDKRWN